LVGNVWWEEIATGRKHLPKLDPYRAKLLQRQTQTFTQRLTFMTIWHPEQHPPPDPKRQRNAHFGDKFV
jgi:hypothetical protein